MERFPFVDPEDAELYDDDDLEPEDDYETLATFISQYSGVCTIDNNHTYKRGDRIAKVQSTRNPFVPVPGVACKHCTRELPRAR